MRTPHRSVAEAKIIPNDRKSRRSETPVLRVNVAVLLRVLALSAAILVFLHLLGLVSTYAFGHGRVFGLVQFFHLDGEGTAPSWFSSVLSLFGALLFLLLWLLVRGDGRRSPQWLLLSMVFAYVSLDESASIHEHLIDPFRETLNLSGFLYFAWVVPYAVLVAALAIYLIPFFRRLGSPFLQQFMMAAVVFLAGAMGMELIAGRIFESLGDGNLAYDLVTVCEESLELTGLILLLRAQLFLLRERCPETHVSLR